MALHDQDSRISANLKQDLEKKCELKLVYMYIRSAEEKWVLNDVRFEEGLAMRVRNFQGCCVGIGVVKIGRHRNRPNGTFHVTYIDKLLSFLML